MNISKYVLLVILLFVVVAVSVAVILHLMNKIDEVEGLYVNTNADLEQVINDKGEQETRIRTLETSNTNLFLKLDAKDSTIRRLQSIVKEKTSINKKLQSALIINNEITLLYQDSIKSLITSGDTIVKGDTIYIYPVYKRDLSMYGEWITGSVTMAKKYLGIDINVRSEYEVVIGRERRNIFTEWQSYAKIKNLNPYDRTKELRAYSKREVKRPFHIIGFVGVDIHLEPTVGVGVGFSIINL